jgi:hypothetical protein
LTNPELKAALASVNDGVRAMLRERLAIAHEQNPDFPLNEDAAIVMIVALIQGLKLEYLERGHTPALDAALETFKQSLILIGDRTAAGTPTPKPAQG